MNEKKLFRKKMRDILNSLDPVAKAFESAGLCLSFIQSAEYKAAKIIFGFMPLKDEVDVLPILRAALNDGKKVLLPRIAPPAENADSIKTENACKMDFYYIEEDPIAETEANQWGIYEPRAFNKKANLEEICAAYSANEIAILVPGLAFTKEGFRLGRGGGYYDFFLSQFLQLFDAAKTERPLFLGVCYKAQIVKSLPHEEHDIQVARLISGSEIF